jgi:hypothetical protein
MAGSYKNTLESQRKLLTGPHFRHLLSHAAMHHRRCARRDGSTHTQTPISLLRLRLPDSLGCGREQPRRMNSFKVRLNLGTSIVPSAALAPRHASASVARSLSVSPAHPSFFVSSAHRHPPLLACPIPALVVDSFPSRNGVPGGGDPRGWGGGGGGCRRAGCGRRAGGPGRPRPAQEPPQRAPR